jgi:ABC-type transport system involved in multi-copper enzyme maturation permease subunit
MVSLLERMNPVLVKDLLGLLRLKRVAAVQVLFVLTMAATVLFTWPQAGVVPLASQGRDDLLLGLVIGQLALLILFVPGVAAVSLTAEREGNTLEMLYASRLSPMQIIVGKALSALAFPAMLLLAGLPFAAMLRWRGDVDFTALLQAYAILLLAALLLAAVSLAVSAVCRQTSMALVVSYVVMLALCGASLVPAAIMLDTQSGIGAVILHFVRGVSPIAAEMSILRAQPGDFAGEVHGLPTSSLIFYPFATALIIASFVMVTLRLRRPPTQPEAAGPAPTDEPRSMGRRMLYLIDDKKARRPISSINPLFAKEARTNSLRSGRWMIRIFYGCLFLSLGLALMSLYSGAEHQDLLAYVSEVLVVLQVGVIALVAPSLTSPAISSELESGTFETLRLSRLSGGQIFWGKLLPALPSAFLPVIALIPAYGALCFINPSYLLLLLRLLPVLATAVVLCCTIGLTCSTLAGNTARATVSAYLVTAALFVLPLLGVFASTSVLNVHLARWLAVPSPLVMGLASFGDPTQDIGGIWPEINRLWADHLLFTAGLCIALLIVARVRLSILLRRG